jgi:hypothetical protein
VARIPVTDVERFLHRVYIAAEGTRLRDEDRKKARELSALLDEIARAGRRAAIVDAAAGHAYAGLAAASLLGGVERLTIIERDEARAARAAAAAAALGIAAECRTGDVSDETLWPGSPDLVVALHACGPAADAVLDRAIAAGARRLLLVPCCYSHALEFGGAAERMVDSLSIPEHAELRRPIVQSLVDADRTLRLERAGYEVELVAFVPKSITPHNLLFRARRMNDPTRMRAAAERHARLRGD